jgi:ABC transport system ATP-binding/permease protein
MEASTGISSGNQAIEPDLVQHDVQNIPGTGAVLLQAKGLTIRTQARQSLLADISFHIEPGELVVLTGPKGSGKSTLLQSLAGLLKPTNGEISINGVSLYANLKAFQSSIGFIPAEFAVSQRLTVLEILLDEATLRLPHSTSIHEREQWVRALLGVVKLTRLADCQVGQLTKIDKRKLSIAVELVGRPGLLLLDESADPLNGFEEAQITTLLQELSLRGLTVIQVSGVSRNIRPTDKVIILAPGGLLAWFGPAEETFDFIRSFISEKSSTIPNGIEDVLEMLVSPESDAGTEWAKRFKAHLAYKKYVDDPLHDRYPDLFLKTQPLIRLRSQAKEKLPPVIVPRADAAQKLILLFRRNLRLWAREKTWRLMLAIPLVAAMVDFVVSSPTMSDPQLGDPGRPPIVSGLLVFFDLLVSALLFQNEIFKEKAVYQRECRTTNLSFPYILSKAGLVGIVGIYQGLVWTAIHFAAAGMSRGFQTLLANAITFTLIAFIGGILGLMASNLSRTAMLTTTWVLILTIPQLLLSGSIIPLSHLNLPFFLLSEVNPSRFAFETLLTSSGYGLDVASDPCWKLPADQRNSLSDVQKQSCPCMGDNIFSICRFPGIHAFYSYVIEQPRPAPPLANSAINTIPVQPLPEQGETLNQFDAKMNDYAAQMESYFGKYTAYLSTTREYSDILANWQRNRSLIIGNAEGVIAEAIDHYGQAFNVNLMSHWSSLAALSLGLVVLLIGIQNRRSYAKI